MATRGEVTEAVVLDEMLRRGFEVLVPWASDLAYDLVVSAPGGPFLRVQCKSGRERDGCVAFNSRSTDHGRGQRDYVGRADVFAVWCPTLDRVFVLPVDEAGRSLTLLRLRPTRNNQARRVRLAADHTIDAWAARVLAGAPVAGREAREDLREAA